MREEPGTRILFASVIAILYGIISLIAILANSLFVVENSSFDNARRFGMRTPGTIESVQDLGQQRYVVNVSFYMNNSHFLSTRQATIVDRERKLVVPGSVTVLYLPRDTSQVFIEEYGDPWPKPLVIPWAEILKSLAFIGGGALVLWFVTTYVVPEPENKRLDAP